MRERGFTIIEVMLFLAVSSLLAVAILGGSSYAINQQRYTESLNSLQGLLQQQYTETMHVVNTRSTDDASVRCDGTNVDTDAGATGQRPGRSECLIMGRAVMFSSDRRTITLANILGYPTGEKATTDLAELQRYRYIISPIDQIKNEVAWGGELAMYRGDSATTAGRAVYLIILRSPLTGAVHTFSLPPRDEGNFTLVTEGDEGIVKENMVDTRLCIDRDMFSVGPRLGVKVHANASSSAGVEILGDDGGCAL